ncbi:hypothetical protein BV898_05661 [Hypsibius exemplaris]|uniref:Uncharacterized protein n=1 Tax=Hypsibius exemplaris TaxID=2072580 RepID=A0A1W0WYT7_HYPEX|nr:hypothetical protein BV898_05661 [Hypsibius exemplaris]
MVDDSDDCILLEEIVRVELEEVECIGEVKKVEYLGDLRDLGGTIKKERNERSLRAAIPRNDALSEDLFRLEVTETSTPRPLRRTSSDDSGTSSQNSNGQENEIPAAFEDIQPAYTAHGDDDDDVLLTKPPIVYPEGSLKTIANVRREELRRRGGILPHYNNYTAPNKPSQSANIPPAESIPEQPAKFQDENFDNWVRKPMKPKAPRPPQPVDIFLAERKKPRRDSLPVAASQAVQSEQKPAGWFNRNLMDMGRSISAPPGDETSFQGYPRSPSPTVECDGDYDNQSVRGDAMPVPETVAPPAGTPKTTIVFRANSVNAMIELESFCANQKIDMDGAVRVMEGTRPGEQLAEIVVACRLYAEKLVRNYDGRTLPGTGNRVRCWIKDLESGPGKVQFQPNSGQFAVSLNRKRNSDQMPRSHEEMDKALEAYKKKKKAPSEEEEKGPSPPPMGPSEEETSPMPRSEEAPPTSSPQSRMEEVVGDESVEVLQL